MFNEDLSSKYLIGIVKVPLEDLSNLTRGVMENGEVLDFFNSIGTAAQREVNINDPEFVAFTDSMRVNGYYASSQLKLVLAPFLIRTALANSDTKSITKTASTTTTTKLNSIDEQFKPTHPLLSLPPPSRFTSTSFHTTSESQIEININAILKACWKGRKEIEIEDLDERVKQSFFLFPDGRNRAAAALIILNERIADFKDSSGAGKGLTEVERKEKINKLKNEFRLPVAIYESDPLAYTSLSTSNAMNLSIIDSRFKFGNGGSQEILVRRLAGKNVPLRRADSHRYMYQYNLRTYIAATTLQHSATSMLNLYTGGNTSVTGVFKGSVQASSQVVTMMILGPFVESVLEDNYFLGPTTIAGNGIHTLINKKLGFSRILHVPGFYSTSTSLSPEQLAVFRSNLGEYKLILEDVKEQVERNTAEEISKIINSAEGNSTSVAFIPGNWKPTELKAGKSDKEEGQEVVEEVELELKAKKGKGKKVDLGRLDCFVSKKERETEIKSFPSKLKGAISKVDALLKLSEEPDDTSQLVEFLKEFSGTCKKRITISDLSSLTNKIRPDRANITSSLFKDSLLTQKYLLDPWSRSLLLQGHATYLSSDETSPLDPRSRINYNSISTPHNNLTHALLIAGEASRSILSPFFVKEDLSNGIRPVQQHSYNSSSIFSTSGNPTPSTSFSVGAFGSLDAEGVNGSNDSVGIARMLHFEKDVTQAVQSNLIEAVVVAIYCHFLRVEKQLLKHDTSPSIPIPQKQPTTPNSSIFISTFFPPSAILEPELSESSALSYKEFHPLLVQLNSILPSYSIPISKLSTLQLNTLPNSVNSLITEWKNKLLVSGFSFPHDVEDKLHTIVKDLMLERVGKEKGKELELEKKKEKEKGLETELELERVRSVLEQPIIISKAAVAASSSPLPPLASTLNVSEVSKCDSGKQLIDQLVLEGATGGGGGGGVEGIVQMEIIGEASIIRPISSVQPVSLIPRRTSNRMSKRTIESLIELSEGSGEDDNLEVDQLEGEDIEEESDQGGTELLKEKKGKEKDTDRSSTGKAIGNPSSKPSPAKKSRGRAQGASYIVPVQGRLSPSPSPGPSPSTSKLSSLPSFVSPSTSSFSSGSLHTLPLTSLLVPRVTYVTPSVKNEALPPLEEDLLLAEQISKNQKEYAFHHIKAFLESNSDPGSNLCGLVVCSDVKLRNELMGIFINTESTTTATDGVLNYWCYPGDYCVIGFRLKTDQYNNTFQSLITTIAVKTGSIATVYFTYQFTLFPLLALIEDEEVEIQEKQVENFVYSIIWILRSVFSLRDENRITPLLHILATTGQLPPTTIPLESAWMYLQTAPSLSVSNTVFNGIYYFTRRNLVQEKLNPLAPAFLTLLSAPFPVVVEDPSTLIGN